jgi:hypothetical protein
MLDVQILSQALTLSKLHTPNAKYAAVVDFTRRANQHRFFLINVDDKKIEYSWFTSHGTGSGPLEKCERVSNVPESKCSSKGIIKTAETYFSSKFGYALRLDGLEKGVNDHVRKRAIVMHPSKYVSETYMKTHQFPGRSFGCVTLDPGVSKEVIDKLKNGSILFINV